MTKWIDAKVELPLHEGNVLIVDDGEIWIGCWFYLQWFKVCDDGGFDGPLHDVTHWQELPEVPG